jgi:hypothetical protein
MAHTPPQLPLLTSTPALYPGCCLTLSTTLLTLLQRHISQIPYKIDSPIQSEKRSILSIGCGTSLLEALLQRFLDQHCQLYLNGIRDKAGDEANPKTTGTGTGPGTSTSTSTCRWHLEGVEVSAHAQTHAHNPHTYLPPQQIHIVPNTADLCPRAFEKDVKVWMFVYPRMRKLIGTYIDHIVGEGREDSAVSGLGVEMIIWAGPRSDWEDSRGYFDVLRGKGWEVVVDSSRDEGSEVDVGVMAFESVVIVKKVRT